MLLRALGSSLRVRLVLVALLALVPACALVLYLVAQQRAAAIEAAQQAAFRLAQVAASEQRRAIEGVRELLVTLARLREVRERDAAACQAVLADILPQHPVLANVGAATADGDVFCSAVPDASPSGLAGRVELRRVLETRRFSLGDYHLAPDTGRATIGAAYPVFADGNPSALVFAVLDLAGLNRIIEETRLPEGSTVTVVDDAGTIVVRHPDGRAWVGRTLPDAPAIQVVRERREGVAEAAGPDGVARLVGFAPLLDLGVGGGDLYVSVGIPRDAAVAAASGGLVVGLVGLTLTGIAALIAASRGGHALVLRPVTRLISVSRRLADGDLTARYGGPYTGELGELGRAFDLMADAIQERQARLEASLEEIRRQREALSRSEKLAELGRLAAGIAHELRNPLTAISGRLQLLDAQLSSGRPLEPDRLVRHLRAMAEADRRMQRIVQGLVNYARPAKAMLVAVDAVELLSGVRELVAYLARAADVRIAIEAPGTALPVRAEPSELTQILVNLATNAIEAMVPGGGTLSLRAGAEGDTAVIEVADTGPGIAPDAVERVWNAFYTTKSQGTGLGLSIVSALVEKQPGAAITLDTAPGAGTTFRLTLPLAIP